MDVFNSLPTTNELARLQLGASLRKLRETSGMKESALARAANMSQSKISKIENGKASPTVDDIGMILAALDPPPAVRERVLAQFDALSLPEGDNSKIYNLGIDSKQRQFREFETHSAQMRVFEMVLVPGLLQTQDYARAVISNLGSFQPDYVDSAVAARMQRQELVWDTGKNFQIIMLESALWARRGHLDMQLAQLDRIAQMTSRPNLRIGVVRFGSPLPTIINSFTIFDDRYVSAETVASEVVSVSADSINRYRKVFEELSELVDFDATGAIMREVMTDLEERR